MFKYVTTMSALVTMCIFFACSKEKEKFVPESEIEPVKIIDRKNCDELFCFKPNKHSFFYEFTNNFWKQHKNIFLVNFYKDSQKCNYLYESDLIQNIKVVFKPFLCKNNKCPIYLNGSYSVSASNMCDKAYDVVGFFFNKNNFVPLCENVIYENDSINELGFLSLKKEGLCLYKYMFKYQMELNKAEKYRFGILEIVKKGNLELAINNGTSLFYKECETNFCVINDFPVIRKKERFAILFHSCENSRCLITVAYQSDDGLYSFLRESQQITIQPKCDFIQLSQKYNEEQGSIGIISANHEGLCMLELSIGNQKKIIEIKIPANMRNLPNESKIYDLL